MCVRQVVQRAWEHVPKDTRGHQTKPGLHRGQGNSCRRWTKTGAEPGHAEPASCPRRSPGWATHPGYSPRVSSVKPLTGRTRCEPREAEELRGGHQDRERSPLTPFHRGPSECCKWGGCRPPTATWTGLPQKALPASIPHAPADPRHSCPSLTRARFHNHTTGKPSRSRWLRIISIYLERSSVGGGGGESSALNWACLSGVRPLSSEAVGVTALHVPRILAVMAHGCSRGAKSSGHLSRPPAESTWHGPARGPNGDKEA